MATRIFEFGYSKLKKKKRKKEKKNRRINQISKGSIDKFVINTKKDTTKNIDENPINKQRKIA